MRACGHELCCVCGMPTASTELAFEAGEKTVHSSQRHAGLSTAQAQERLETVGSNDPFPPRQTNRLGQLLPLVANPLAGILLGASVVAAIVGETASAVTIAII